MEVKKFEAPTVKEALDHIKRELGPEAVILKTRKYRKGFGLLSKPSVEVTAAVSERSSVKKERVESRIREEDRDSLKNLSAQKLAKLYNKYMDRKAPSDSADLPAGASVSSRTGGRIVSTREVPASYVSKNAFIGQNRSSQESSENVQLSSSGRASSSNRAPTERYADMQDDAHARRVAKRAIQVSPQSPPPGVRVRAEQAGAIDHLNSEVQQLKEVISQLKESAQTHAASSAVAAPGLTMALRQAFEMLISGGVDRTLAHVLIKKAGFNLDENRSQDEDEVLDRLAEQIIDSTEVFDLLAHLEKGKQQVVAIVGPTGVGKTTTVAKIASEAKLKKDLKVGLINVDTYKVSASTQLQEYAGILNAPYRTVHSKEELDLALQEMTHLDLILLDTTGRSQRDSDSINETAKLIKGVKGVRTELVLASTTRDAELSSMGRSYKAAFGPESLILSKLDEALTFGSIYSVSQALKLPLAYFTTGQKVPEDIEAATRERVVSLVMDL